MTLFEKIFGKKEDSAGKAKDRLKMMLAVERADNSLPYMEDLKRDILEVVKRYTSAGDVVIRTEKNQNVDMLELEIKLK
jgi:cell division topological specificity factor